MHNLPDTSFLNSALQVADSPAELSRMLTDRYLKLDAGERDLFVLLLIGQIAATELAKRFAATRET